MAATTSRRLAVTRTAGKSRPRRSLCWTSVARNDRGNHVASVRNGRNVGDLVGDLANARGEDRGGAAGGEAEGDEEEEACADRAGKGNVGAAVWVANVIGIERRGPKHNKCPKKPRVMNPSSYRLRSTLTDPASAVLCQPFPQWEDKTKFEQLYVELV